jgi:hypothetical protein
MKIDIDQTDYTQCVIMTQRIFSSAELEFIKKDFEKYFALFRCAFLGCYSNIIKPSRINLMFGFCKYSWILGETSVTNC